jgi:hypothetical protein
VVKEMGVATRRVGDGSDNLIGCYNGATRVLQGVTRVLQGCYKVLQGFYKGVIEEKGVATRRGSDFFDNLTGSSCCVNTVTTPPQHHQ